MKGRHLQHEYWVLAFGEDCAAPLGLNKCVSMINPGLAPRAMQECRPKGLLYVFPIDTLYCFDALALFIYFNYFYT